MIEAWTLADINELTDYQVESLLIDISEDMIDYNGS